MSPACYHDLVKPRLPFSLLSLLLLALLSVPAAQAAPRDAVARVSSCGPAALATFFVASDSEHLLAFTLASAVVDKTGAPCSAITLVLPEARGRLVAQLAHVRASDDLAILEVGPDQSIPPSVETVALADRPAFDEVLFGKRAVRIYAHLDDTGRVHERVARMEKGDLTSFTVSWLRHLDYPWSAGAPVVAGGGYLLGILAAPRSADSTPRGCGGGLFEFAAKHYGLQRPTAAGKYGIWIATQPGDENGDQQAAIALAIQRRLERAKLDPELWTIRKLGVVIDDPYEQAEPRARWHGASVRADLVVASAWLPGPDDTRLHHSLVLQLSRDGPVGDRDLTEGRPAGARYAEQLVLPVRPHAAPRLVAEVTTSFATAHFARRATPGSQSLEKLRWRALRRVEHMRLEYEHWRAGLRRSGPAGALAERQGAGTLARMHGSALADLDRLPPFYGSQLNRTPFELAIGAWKDAAAAFSPDHHACDWMATHVLLASARLEAADTSPEPELFDVALAEADLALNALPEGTCHYEQAKLLLRRGQLLSRRDGHDLEGELRAAIASYEEALNIFNQLSWPLEWAQTQLELGRAWQRLPSADQAGVLDSAIGAYRRALIVLDKELLPEHWAAAWLGLGQALAANPVGDHEQNLQDAVLALEGALTIYSPERDPVQWAHASNALGSALQQLPYQDPPDHLHRALKAHQDALTVFHRGSHPIQWAITHNHIGKVMRQLPTEDPGRNYEGALLGFATALSILDQQRHPRDWAATQVNLGDAWRANPIGDRAANIAKAIEAYQRALGIYTRDSDPDNWALTWRRLGQTWREQRGGDRGQNLAKAIEAFNTALTVHTREANPLAWERTQADLFVAQAWQYAHQAEQQAPGSLDALVQRGEACLQEGLVRRDRRLPSSGPDLFVEAGEAFERAHALAPQDPMPLDGLVLSWWYRGQYAQAAAVQRRLAALDPSPRVQENLRFYELKAILKADPADTDAWRQLGEHLTGMGYRTEAVDAWNHLLAIRPGDAHALRNLVELCIVLDLPERALQALETATVHAPGDPQVLNVAFLVYSELSTDLIGAFDIARRRLALQPHDADAQLDLVTILLLYGRNAEVQLQLQALVERSDLDPAQSLRLNVLRLLAGQEAARQPLAQAYEELAEEARVFHAWKLLRAHAGSAPEARQERLKAIIDIVAEPRSEENAQRLEALLRAR